MPESLLNKNNVKYSSGKLGVPITYIDSHNPEQIDIIRFRKGNDNKDLQQINYPKYCNGMIGVPVTFIDKYSPEQFIIVGQGQGNLYRLLSSHGLSAEFVKNYYKSGQTGSIKEDHPVLGYYDKNNKPIIPYMRLIIKYIGEYI